MDTPAPPLTFSDEEMGETDENAEEEDIVLPLISDKNHVSVSSDQESTSRKRFSWNESANSQSDMRSKRISKRISMRQVLDHGPYETEAESYIQLSLDENDTVSDGSNSAQKTIMGHVPLDVPLQTFRTENQSISSFRTSLSPNERSEKRKLKKKQRRSTADDLYHLSMELEQFQPARESVTTTASGKDDLSLQNSLLTTASVVMKTEISMFRKQGGAIGIEDDLNSKPSGSIASKQSTSKHHGVETKVHGGGVATIVEEDDDNDEEGEGGETDTEEGMTPNENEPKPNRILGNPTKTARKQVLAEYKDFEDWLRFKRSSVWTHVKLILFFIMLPATGVAAILFYTVGNPPTGLSADGNVTEIQQGTSSSWWILFICCRQAVTFTLARATGSIVVDYFALQTRWLVRAAGPYVTLFIVQSRGWPCILFFWGMYDFMLLYGDGAFARHWLFYQDTIGLFNETNPSGSITSTPRYLITLVLLMIFPFLVAVKRFLFGHFEGQRAFIRYSDELARIMDSALLISETARLSRHIEMSQLLFENFDFKVASYDSSEFAKKSPQAQESKGECLLSGFDTAAKKAKVNELLGAWEELEANRDPKESPDIADVLQFRHSLSYLDSPFPFGTAFGPVSTREECVESAEDVYNRLLQSIPGRDVLIFDVLAMLAISKRGELKEDKLKNLIKLFRPDREGLLTVLDFVKSVDAVYKRMRLLRMNLANSSKLDRDVENLFNVFFLIFLVMIAIASFGINPWKILSSVCAVILAFSYMIATACSNYLQGVLLILMQRPFDIGDRISTALPTTDATRTGTRTWIVQDINLFCTTVAFGPTREVATIANGALGVSRIVNAARSHKAQMNFNLKFPIDTPYAKLKVFKKGLLRFIKARPREWVALVSFRCIRVEADLGYVEYIVNARHRESWQQNGAIKQSRADFSMFLNELGKKMGIIYTAPPMPIDLTLKQGEIHAVGVDDPVSRTGAKDDATTEDHAAEEAAAIFDTELPPR